MSEGVIDSILQAFAPTGLSHRLCIMLCDCRWRTSWIAPSRLDSLLTRREVRRQLAIAAMKATVSTKPSTSTNATTKGSKTAKIAGPNVRRFAIAVALI